MRLIIMDKIHYFPILVLIFIGIAYLLTTEDSTAPVFQGKQIDILVMRPTIMVVPYDSYIDDRGVLRSLK